jgi:DnaJ-class molecular chaperone
MMGFRCPGGRPGSDPGPALRGRARSRLTRRRAPFPAGTSSGRRFRVKGQGVHSSKGQGNLIVTVEVAVPAELDDAAKKAVEDFAGAMAFTFLSR